MLRKNWQHWEKIWSLQVSEIKLFSKCPKMEVLRGLVLSGLSAWHLSDKQAWLDWYFRLRTCRAFWNVAFKRVAFSAFPIYAFMDGVPIISVLVDGINSLRLMISLSLTVLRTLQHMPELWKHRPSITSSSSRERRALRSEVCRCIMGSFGWS